MPTQASRLNVLVLGASGATGRKVVERARAAGHHVTAFVRDPAKLADVDIDVVTGDATDEPDLRKAVAGQDLVISTLGSSGTDQLIQKSTAALLEAMAAAGITRLVMMSSFAAAPDYKPTGLMKVLGLSMKRMVADKNVGETILQNSDIDWTIVYATRLTNKPPTGHYRVVDGAPTGGETISRDDVADALLAIAVDPRSVRRRVVISSID